MVAALIRVFLVVASLGYIHPINYDTLSEMRDVLRELKIGSRHVYGESELKSNQLPSDMKQRHVVSTEIPPPVVMIGEVTSTMIQLLLFPQSGFHDANFHIDTSYSLSYIKPGEFSIANMMLFPVAEEELTLVSLAGLEPSTEYNIGVSLANDRASWNSTKVNATTLATNIPRAPEVYVVSAVNSEILLEIRKRPDNVPVTSYRVEDLFEIHGEIDADADTLPYHITDAVPDQARFIKVTSLNGAIVGSGTSIIVASRHVWSPTVSIKRRTAEAITIEVKPAAYDEGSEHVHYRITCFMVDFQNDSHIKFVDQCDDFDKCDYVIDELLGSTKYVISVSARRGSSYGPEGTVICATKPPTVPGFVRVISRVRGTRRVAYLLRWRRPSTGGRPILEYIVRYIQMKTDGNSWDESDHVGNWTTISIPNGEATQQRLSHLLSHSRYKVFICARNIIGKSYDTHHVFKTCCK